MLAQIRKMGESQKVAIRNIRRDANKKIDAEQKEKKISEDDADNAKKSIQELTKKHEEKIGSFVDKKCREVEEV